MFKVFRFVEDSYDASCFYFKVTSWWLLFKFYMKLLKLNLKVDKIKIIFLNIKLYAFLLINFYNQICRHIFLNQFNRAEHLLENHLVTQLLQFLITP